MTDNTHIIMPGNSFTKADIDKSHKFNPRENTPEFYGEDLPKDVEYLGSQVMKPDDIKLDNFFKDGSEDQNKMIQSIRAKEVKRKELTNSLQRGYDLREHLISVRLDEKTGKTFILDGRGKYFIMQKLGWDNLLVDIYKCKTPLAYSRLGNIKNRPAKVANPISKLDVVKHLTTHKEQLGITDKMSNDEIADIFTKEAKLIGNPIWQKPTYDKIVLQAISEVGKYQIVVHDETSATRWAKANNYVDVEDSGIFYMISSAATPAKTILRAAKQAKYYTDNAKIFKELRIILHHGFLEGADPEGSWKKTKDKGLKDFNDYKDLLKYYFTNDKKELKFSNKIKLYGITPALEELEDDYPLNKVVKYDMIEEIQEALETEETIKPDFEGPLGV